MLTNIKKALLLLSLLFIASLTAQEVTIGYQGINNPWKYPIDQGTFERVTGYKINWRRFESGGEVAPAMASKNVQIALSGSTGIASMASGGLDIQVFWILENINDAEALVARDGSGINSVKDLVGKTLGVPFGSTTHFHTLFALELNNINPNQVDIKNLQPPAMIAPWQKGDIDAVFVWDPVLANVKQSGKVILTSGDLSAAGKPTFDGLIVDRKWARANRKFMAQFVRIIADTDAAYKKNPSAWSEDSPQVAAIAKLSGANPADVPATLALYDFPSIQEQVSKAWLGGGKNGGVVQALQATSEFLKANRAIQQVRRSYTRFVTTAYVKAAMDVDL